MKEGNNFQISCWDVGMLICKQGEVNAGLPNCVPSFKNGRVVDEGEKVVLINTMHLLYLLP